MGIETRRIENRDTWLEWREEDMTASIGACLFGDIHPYMTAYEQWALKSGLVKRRAMAERLARRGRYVEKIAPEIIVEERPSWGIVPCEYYYRDPEAKIGATPDILARRPDIAGRGVIDVKSVGAQIFRRWRDRDTGDTELPVWMAIQCNIQASLVEEAHEEPVTWGAVAAITIGDGGLDVEILDVPILPGLMANFRELTKEFWRRVEEKDPYPIDWGRDAETVLDMYADDRGGVVDLSNDPEIDGILVERAEHKQLEAQGTAAKAQRRLLDVRLIHKMGNAAAARTASGLIKAPTVRVKEAVRKAYTFRKITVSGEAYSDHTTDVAE